MLTARRVRELLRDHQLAPNRRLGQNFVVDHNTLRKVVRDAGVGGGTRVCEVGPGLGSLTLALRDAGAQVTAIEVDAGMVRALREVIGADPMVCIVHADVRSVDLSQLVPRPAMVVANLPYSIATSVTLDILALEHFDRLHLMVQREVGQRWCATVGDRLFGAVSVKIAAFADAQLRARVSRRAFYPVPNVDSVTVGLRPRPWTAAIDRPAVLTLVDRGFATRRKTLRNALAPHIPAAAVDAALVDVGRPRDARAEQLDLPTWCELAIALRERHIA